MDTPKEPVPIKPCRPRSAARYPKRMNTFVVAFAVEDNNDNKSKTASHKKRSPEKSLSTSGPLSPSGSNTSTKTFTITGTGKIPHPLAIASVSEVKIDMLSDIQDNDTEKLISQNNNYVVGDNFMDGQSKILFSPAENLKKPRENYRSFSKFSIKKDKNVDKFKNVHFKYKKSRNKTARSIEKNCVKAKMKSPNTRQIKELYSDNISTVVVTRPNIPKEAVNSLDDIGQISLTDFYGFNENDNGSLNSSVCTTKRLSSYDSQNTLMNNSFLTVNSNDFYSMKSDNSIIQEPSQLMPYKTDTINVAVALSPSKTKNYQSKIITNEEELDGKEYISSNHTISFTRMELTSQAPSDESSKNAGKTLNCPNDMKLIETDLSNDTLIGFEKESFCVNSEHNTFRVVRTSSEFNKSNDPSDIEMASNSEVTLESEQLNISTILHSAETIKLPNNNAGRDTLLDTVKKLGFYPEITASTGSRQNLNNDFNDVIVTENVITNYPQAFKKDDIKISTTQNELSRNILLKSFDIKHNDQPNNIHLPDDVAIRSALKDTNKLEKKIYPEELNNQRPTDLIEMWDRVTLILDLAVRNLEQTLANKIVEELKMLVPKCLQESKKSNPTSETSLNRKKNREIWTKKPEQQISQKEENVVEQNFRNENDQGLQCDLIHNQVIDQIMLKLSVEGPKALNGSQISLKSLNKPRLNQGHVELLKVPAVDDIEAGKGDTMSVGTATSIPPKINHRILDSTLCSRPMTFFRENLLVITSVPTFFLILLCLYGVFSSIARSW